MLTIDNPFNSNFELQVKTIRTTPIPTLRNVPVLRKLTKLQDVGFVLGFKHSWFATAIKQVSGYENPFDYTQYLPTAELRSKALLELDYNISRYKSALRGASTYEDFKNNVKIAKDNQLYDRRLSQATIASRLLSSLGSTFSDPFTLTPVGGSSLIGRLALGAASGAMTSVMNLYVSGGLDDPIESFGWGIAIGGTILGLAKGSPYAKAFFGNMGRNSKSRLLQLAKNQYVDLKSSYKQSGVAGAVNSAISKILKVLPAMTIKGARDKAKTQLLKDLYDMMGGSERGVKTTDELGKTLYKQFSSKTPFTALEYKSYYIDLGLRKIDDYQDGFVKVLKETDISPLLLDHYVRRSIDGYSTPLDNNSNFRLIVSKKQAFYGSRGDLLQGAGIIRGLTSSPFLYTYLPHKVDRVKISNMLNLIILSTGVSTTLAKQVLRNRVKALLLRSLLDSNYYDLLKKKFTELYKKKNPNNVVPATDAQLLKQFRDWVLDQALKDSLGYIDGKLMVRKNLTDDFIGLTYSYQLTRNPWKFTILDGDGFSIDRLLISSLLLMHSYNNRSSADLGANKVFGVTNAQELKNKFDDAINKLGLLSKNAFYPLKREQALAVKAMLDSYYGRLGQDALDGGSWAAALSDSLSHLSLFAHNAYIGLLNHFEIALGIKAYGLPFFIKSMPGIRSRFSDWSKGGMSKQLRNLTLNYLFGREVKRRGLWRLLKNRNIQRFLGNRAKVAMVTGTLWLATHSPLTKYIDASNTSIVDLARSQFLGDLIHYAHGTRDRIPFLDKKIRDRLSISDKQYNKLINSIKKATTITDDKISMNAKLWKDLIESDLLTFMTIRRLGNYVADLVIQRNDLMDTFLWKGSKHNNFMRLLMQFKTFAVRSYNKRLMKSFNRILLGLKASQAMTWMISGALGTVGLMCQMGLTVSGMNDLQRRAYFKNTLGDLNPDWLSPTTWMNVFMNGYLRSSILAAPALALSSLGVRAGIKTSVDLGVYKKDLAGQLDLDLFSRSYIPAYNTLRGIYGLRADVRNVFMSNYISHDDFRNRDRLKYQRSFARNLKSVTPNIPYIQNSFINYISEED